MPISQDYCSVWPKRLLPEICVNCWGSSILYDLFLRPCQKRSLAERQDDVLHDEVGITRFWQLSDVGLIRSSLCCSLTKHKECLVHSQGKSKCTYRYMCARRKADRQRQTSIYICTYTYTCTDIHTCIHAHIHTYVRTYIHTYIHTYMHTYIHIHIYTNEYQYRQVPRHTDIDKYTGHTRTCTFTYGACNLKASSNDEKCRCFSVTNPNPRSPSTQL